LPVEYAEAVRLLIPVSERPSVKVSLGEHGIDINGGPYLFYLRFDEMNDVGRGAVPFKLWIDEMFKITAGISCQNRTMSVIVDHTGETEAHEAAVR